MIAKQLRHARVQIDQCDALHIAVFQHFARGHPVPTAKDQHRVAPRGKAHGRMHQRLVVAVLIKAIELDRVVQEQPDPVAVAGDGDLLVGRGLRQDDVILEKLRFGDRDQPLGLHQRGQSRHQRHRPDPGLDPQRVVAKQVQRQPRHPKVERTKGKAGRHQPQMRDDQQRKADRRHQCADVIHRQHVLEPEGGRADLLQDAGDQGNLHPRQGANGDQRAIKRQADLAQPRVEEKQRGRQKPAQNPKCNLRPDEPGHGVADKARQPRPQTHRGQEDPDHQRKLTHGIAQKVAGNRRRDQLINQPRNGDQEGGRQQPDGPQITHPTGRHETMTAAIMIAMAMNSIPTRIANAMF